MIFIPKSVIYSEYNSKISYVEENFESRVLNNKEYKFIVICTDLSKAEYIKSYFSRFKNYYPKTCFKNKAVGEIVYGLITGTTAITILYEKQFPKFLYKFRLTKDGSVVVKIPSNENLEFELHYDSNFISQIKEYNADIVSSAGKKNKRFYQRFKKWLT